VDPGFILGLCEGDCDSDSECEAGLVCFQRDGFETIPGCSGNGISAYDYCVDPVLVTIGVDPSGILGLCRGDCDTDSDCEGSLKCFQRNGSETIPGCIGSGQNGYDYCYQPALVDLGVEPSVTLGLCEGDCDNDSDCEAGLECFQRDGLETVPGCGGSGTSAYDYCIEPVPSVSPSEAPSKGSSASPSASPSTSPSTSPSGSCSDSETMFTLVKYPDYPDIECSRIAQQLTDKPDSIGSRVCLSFEVEEGGFVVDYCPAMCATYGTGPCA